MSKFFVYSARPSDGAKELATALDGKRIKTEGSTYKSKASHVLVNWGNSSLPFKPLGKVLNPPEAVASASNKLTTFQLLSQEICPPWTVSQDEAAKWLESGKTVCVRQKLRSSGADGLVIFGPENFKEWGTLSKAPLYTEYIKKAAEYRIHVYKDMVIDYQQKRLRSDMPEGFKPNYQIQNLENGFIYARENVQPPKTVMDNAIRAVAQLGLDFGAVDVIYNEKKSLAIVLEVNTAPGLQGTTIQSYANAIREDKELVYNSISA